MLRTCYSRQVGDPFAERLRTYGRLPNLPSATRPNLGLFLVERLSTE
ncbi:MAG: hypothetical protein LBB88_08380 [Planctomycetaceae bacterium]|nr:hypothetical protein [Planctomycetaceae bacterium]